MSTIAYAMITSRREEAPPGRGAAGGEGSMTTAADALTALVPAEVLTAHAIIALAFVEERDVDGASARVIVDADSFRLAFWGLALLASLLYLAARYVSGKSDPKRRLERWDAVRCLVPMLAFCAWTMLVGPSAFDAAYPAFDDGTQLVLAVLGYAFLGGAASVLGIRANERVPQ